MSQELRTGQHLSIGLEQRLGLQQIMLTSQVLSMPIGALDILLVALVSNPQHAEEIIRESRREKSDGRNHGLKSLYGGLVTEGGSQKKDFGGTITTFNPENMARLFGKESEILIVPDVTYVGKENNKPEMEFSSHLSPKPEMSFLTIPSQFKDTASLYTKLCKEREWIGKTLREMYAQLGERQREFLYSLKFVDMNIFDEKDVAKELNLSPSFVSRLRESRLVRIGAGGNVVEVKMLMPTQDKIYRYQIHEKINLALEEEVKNSSALIDSQIAGRIKSRRRTIAKYRTLAHISVGTERQTAYRNGRKEAYHIPETLPELVAAESRSAY